MMQIVGATGTIIWIVLPFLVGFSGYLLPRLTRHLALGLALISAVYGLLRIWQPPLSLQLIDSFGVTLVADSLSGNFILTNALVMAAVVIYCWGSGKSAFFYTQAVILHGSVNAVFVCADFISLYVALEVISIAAFLLIAYPRTDRSIWVGLRYLFISNTAMLFYLIGTALVYQSSHSFAYTGLQGAPLEARVLILLGLLTKGGIFVSGLWLPLTHAEAETPVSALLSGAVVKTGVFSLVRCALLVEDLGPLLQLFSLGTAALGVSYALLEKDTKRTLAASTISQLGFVLAVPSLAGSYALAHGTAKAMLFLLAGNLPSRRFAELRQQPMPQWMWGGVAIASLSIAGFPLLVGYGAKATVLGATSGWLRIGLNLAAVGTAAVFAKFLFLPVSGVAQNSNRGLQLATGLLGAVILGLGWTGSYSAFSLAKSLITIALGWLAYWLLQKTPLRLPGAAERIEHLIGTMTLMLLLLFGLGLA